MHGGALQKSATPELSLEDIGCTLLAVAEKARIGVVITELGSQGSVVGPLYINDAAVSIFGQPRESLMRENLLDHVAEDVRPAAAELVMRILANEPVGSVLETVVVRADGARLPVRVTFVMVTHGHRVFTVNLISDVTERNRLQEQLARAHRLAALGTLAAGVAHEINNPLSFTALNVEALYKLIEAGMPDPDARARALDVLGEVQAGTGRVASIVRDLNAFTKADGREDVPVDVPVVVRSAERLVMHEIRDDARIVIDLPELPTVNAGAVRLEQVFVNLLLNAAQAFESRGPHNRIGVSGGLTDEGSVYVDVTDNGPGIPPQVLDRIFDPFFTTKPVGSGAGLGLWIAHGIVSRLGGNLTVKSTLGYGSTFRVVLPVRSGSTFGVTGPSPKEASRRVAARILVVDDEPAIGESLRLLLEDHHVDVVTSGEKALARLLTERAHYDVLLCDISMRGISGVEVYERVARDRPGVERRIVFMTGGCVNTRERAFLSRVSNLVLDKPFTAGALEEALQAVIENERTVGAVPAAPR